MDYISHPVLYSDNFIDNEWSLLLEKMESRSKFWRKYAKRKMRRIVRELLNGTRPRISMGRL